MKTVKNKEQELVSQIKELHKQIKHYQQQKFEVFSEFFKEHDSLFGKKILFNNLEKLYNISFDHENYLIIYSNVMLNAITVYDLKKFELEKLPVSDKAIKSFICDLFGIELVTDSEVASFLVKRLPVFKHNKHNLNYI